MQFAQILKDLRNDISLPQDKFALEIGYSKSIISDWENEKKLPNAQALCILSKYFKVSCDYLLGLEDEWGGKSSTEIVSIKETRLLQNYKNLDDWGKQRLENFLDALLDSNKFVKENKKIN